MAFYGRPRELDPYLVLAPDLVYPTLVVSGLVLGLGGLYRVALGLRGFTGVVSLVLGVLVGPGHRGVPSRFSVVSPSASS